MAAPTTHLHHPGGARAVQSSPAPFDGSGSERLIEERLLSHGVIVGQHVQDAGYYLVTVPAGAPGTVDVNLLTALDPVGNRGGTIQPVAGKLVYLELVRMTGADTRIRRSAANAIEVLDGTTDTIDMPGGRCVLFDALPSTAARQTTGLDFDATHKQLQIESTAGCTVAILAAVV